MNRHFAAVAILAAFAYAVPASGADASAKKWKDAAEVSVVSTNGNSKSQTTSAKNNFSYKFNELTSLNVEAGALGARGEGKVTAEQYFVVEKAIHKLDDRNYIFERYRWDRNRFMDLAHRHDLSAGVGRELWKTPADLLVGEVAPGYINEERFRDRRKSFASARAYSKYTHDFTPAARFSQDLEYIQSLKDKRDNRINTETALTAAFNSVFSVKNSFIWRHDSRPATGARKDDTILAVAMIAGF
jgi:putative salt-induced outer membrane protein YdiY